tara:strand:+ start:987 stop:1124 length:138 start_codon:yes stop_codon:yes gene_type:complete
MVKKHNVFETFEYLRRQIRDPLIPIMPLKNKLLERRGFANPNTKK